MIVVPAMDLWDRKIVRLEQGDLNRVTVYSEIPPEIAEEFIEYGATKIHLVDLNAAVGLDSKTNNEIIDDLLNGLGTSVDFQVAGGIRALSRASSLSDRGAKSIVLGSIAYSDPPVAKEILSVLGRERVVLALDYDAFGYVKTSGWKKTEDEQVERAIARFLESGFSQFLLTSTSRDGLMRGPDLERLRTLKTVSSGSKITASGGVSSEEDIENLSKIGIEEVIVGKALYEKSIPLSILGRVA
jgi:phosphoribosylformimino-5-aminoimidazole carboxamide ribotide isomerase